VTGPSPSATVSAPVLEGPRLRLRPLGPDDVGSAYVRWLNDREVTRYLESGREPVTEADLHRYLERFAGSRTDFIFAIVERDRGRHIGNVTLNHVDAAARTADTGLMIGERSAWGRGYATEAWALLLDWAFRAHGPLAIQAGACAGNVASVKALLRLGFRLENVVPDACRVDGARMDALRFTLSAEDFDRAGAVFVRGHPS